MKKTSNGESIVDETQKYAKDIDVEKLFKDRQDDRVKLLQESILDIKEMIQGRQDLHSDIMKSIEKVELFINNNMPSLGSISHEVLVAQKDLIKELLKKKIEMDELKVQENLNVWRDIALLKKELREHMKEYRDMESKSSMIDNILGL